MNLTTKPWIKVLDLQYNERTLSLRELFASSHKIFALAGETPPQNLSVLRMLLAVFQTVMYREGLEFDGIFENGKFPNEFIDYLDKWVNHFNLYDDAHPFYQALPADIEEKHTGLRPSKALGRTINRTISDSGNKDNLFSPSSSANRDKMTDDELVRWLIAYQNYTGNSEKSIFNTVDKYTGSKGWLYSTSAVYIEGDNLFETIMLNYIPEANAPRPIWERPMSEVIADRLANKPIDNLAELYTLPSRALAIKHRDNLEFESVRLPKLDPVKVDPMALWKSDKEVITPKLIAPQTSLWRYWEFLRGDLKPIILTALQDKEIGDGLIRLSVVGMQDDWSASSRPIDTIHDSIDLKIGALEDDTPLKIIEMISNYYRWFLRDTEKFKGHVRGNTKDNIEKMYWLVDDKVKRYLREENSDILGEVERIILQEAEKVLIEHNQNLRMLKGIDIVVDDKTRTHNIYTAYSQLEFRLNEIKKEDL